MQGRAHQASAGKSGAASSRAGKRERLHERAFLFFIGHEVAHRSFVQHQLMIGTNERRVALAAAGSLEWAELINGVLPRPVARDEIALDLFFVLRR